MNSKRWGFVIITLVICVITLLFYWTPFTNPNKVFFASSGDGLKDYLNTYFFIKYDTSFWHSESMNYPYGEHVFFTGNQPSVSHPLKFIDQYLFPVSDYTVGILNLLMLSSIIIGGVFIYLILLQLKLPIWYSVLVAVGITFLSPQLARLPGHFSLSYIFAIPVMLYLMMLFHHKPKIWKSIIIGLFVLWAFGTHVYMLGFHAAIILFYWFYSFTFLRSHRKYKQDFLHLGIQFLIPFLILVLITSLTDNITDRTAYPWGYLYYRAYPESVFLPLGFSHGKFFRNFSDFNYIDWEGIAYVGTISSFGFFVLLFFLFKNLFKKKFERIGTPSDVQILNIFFWASLATLIYSFGFPFIIGDAKYLLHYLGPIKQMRGIARFAWLFYYVFNIFIFYHIWKLRKTAIKKTIWIIIVVLSLSVLFYEAYRNVSFWSGFVKNEIPELADVYNDSEINSWVELIDKEKYQATIPLPYYHVGSENTWLLDKCSMAKPSFIISWKTGLPSMGVMLSRTSIGQTYSSFSLFQEPYRFPEIINKFDSEKNFLIVTKNDCNSYSPQENNLIHQSTLIYESPEFNLYDLPYDSLLKVVQNPYKSIVNAFENDTLFSHGNYYSNQKEKLFKVYNSEALSDSGELKKKVISDRFSKSDWIYHKEIPFKSNEDEYIFSFWVNSDQADLFLRSSIIFQVRDSLDQGHTETKQDLFRILKIIDDDWALIELKFKLKEEGSFVRWRIRNRDIMKAKYHVGPVMIRPLKTNVYLNEKSFVMKNNRYYVADTRFIQAK